MRIVILYHPKSDHGGKVEDYARDYHQRRPDREIELLSLETKKGWEMAKLYDVTNYPSVLAIAEDGSLQKLWQDSTGQDLLPLSQDLDAYSQ